MGLILVQIDTALYPKWNFLGSEMHLCQPYRRAGGRPRSVTVWKHWSNYIRLAAKSSYCARWRL